MSERDRHFFFQVVFYILCLEGCVPHPLESYTNTSANNFETTGGSFSSQGSMTSSDANSIYQLGCLQPGQPQPVPAVDSRLKIGNWYKIDEKFFSLVTKSWGISLSSSVENLTQSSITLNQLVMAVNGLPDLHIGESISKTCAVQSDGTSLCDKGVTNGEGPDFQFSCSLTKVDISSTNQLLGHYDMVSQKNLNSHQTVTHQHGLIQCPGQPASPGTFSMKVIQSADVPSPFLEWCGGTLLYSSAEFELDTTKVLEASYFEITDFGPED